MQLKEGRCPNCGSLLQLDATKDQGHCLFCDAVFASKEAFDIAANPAGVTFPNLPQPKYEGPNLNPQLNNAQFNVRQVQMETSKKQQAKAAKPAQPVYVPREDLQIPDMKLAPRTRLILTGSAVLLIAVIVALSAPPIMKRNAARSQLVAAIPTISPIAVDPEQMAVIHGLHNQRLDLALPEAITAEQARDVFTAYAQQRAAVMGRDPQDFQATKADLIVKIVTPAGGYLIERPASQTALEDGSAILKLS